MKRQIPFLIYFLLFFGAIKAQENVRSFYHFNKNNGLVSDHVQHIAQDEEGFVWLATTDGLVKYDGYHFRVFRYNPNDSFSLSCNNITFLLPISNHQILVGTFDCGLNIFDTYTEKSERIYNDTNIHGEIGDNRVLSMFKDKQNRIWVGLNDETLNLFDVEKKKIIPIKSHHKEGKTFSSSHGFCEHFSDTNLMWIATSSGLVLMNKNDFSYEIFKFSDEYPDASWLFNRYRFPIQTDAENIWMSSWGGGVVHYNLAKKHWENFLLNAEPPLTGGKNIVLEIVPKSKSEFWIITADSGLGIFDMQSKKMEFLDVEKSNDETYVRNIKEAGKDLFIDKDKNIWTGFASGLMFHQSQNIFKKTEIPKITQSNLKNFNYPFYFLEDSIQNGLWVASYQADGLCFFDRKNNTWQVFPIPSKILFPRGMIWDEKGKILFLTANEFLEFDTDKKTYKKVITPDTIQINKYGGYSLFKSKNEKLYIGTTRFGVMEWDRKINKIRHFYHQENNPKSLLANEPIYDLAEDINGNIWVGMESGVSILDVNKGDFKHFSYKLGTQNRIFKNIANIKTTANGKVWLSSISSGLLCIDAKNNYSISKPFDLSTGLLSNSIFGLEKCNDTLLLIYTDYGLQYFNPSNWKSSFYSTEYDFPFYTSEWGSLQVIGSKMYLGFFQNFIETDIGNFKFPNPPKAPKIVRVTVFDKEFLKENLTDIKELNFNYHENFIRIYFSNFDFAQIKKLRLNYTIKGLSNDTFFTDKNINEITLTGLAPKNYKLVVWYSFPESNICSETLSFWVKIHPPWWKTWWFITLLFFAFFITVFAIYQYRLRQSREKSNLKRQLAEMENTALRAQMNPHFLFNSLNSVNYYILNNEPKKASQYLKKFSKMVRLILNNSRKNTVTLDDELEALKVYLELEELRFNKHFSYEIKVDENVHLSDIIIPPLLIQPYVENAIWHGIMQSENGGMVQINIFGNEDQYTFEIIDNGIGRKKAGALKSKSALEQKSHGMDITNERIRLFNTTHVQNIKVEITDFGTEDLPEGTKIKIIYTTHQNESSNIRR